MVTEYDLVQLCALCRDRLAAQGFEVEQCVDFDRVGAVLDGLEKPYRTRHLSPEFHDFTRTASFWVFLKRNDAYVGCVGVRYDDIGEEPIHRWWERQAGRLYGAPSGESSVLIKGPQPRFLDEVKGGLVYVGDLFMLTDGTLTRRLDLRAFMFLVYSLAYIRWDVDWIYSFIKDKHVRRGYAAIYAASHQFPGVQRWREEPAERDSSEWFTCSSAEDFRYLIAHYVAHSDDF